MKMLLKVENLKKHFPVHKGILRRVVDSVKAVDGVSFEIHEGEVVGLVGESGSGKSTVGYTTLRLIEPTSGNIFFKNANLCSLSASELKAKRREIQMVFQDPIASLNPRKTIFANIGESLLLHKLVANRNEQARAVAKILEHVGIAPDSMNLYPHQFSGGQQQRISIGRAIAVRPKLLICDEAVSALDLSIQGQILNLLNDLKKTLKLSYLFITHDLSVVRAFCDRVLVMYKGKIVESGPSNSLFKNPKHPYTKFLLASVPKKHPLEKREGLSLINSSSVKYNEKGCAFFPRCPVSNPHCSSTFPPLKEQNKDHHYLCIH